MTMHTALLGNRTECHESFTLRTYGWWIGWYLSEPAMDWHPGSIDRLAASTKGLRKKKKWEFKYYRRRRRRRCHCGAPGHLWHVGKTLNGLFTSLFGWVSTMCGVLFSGQHIISLDFFFVNSRLPSVCIVSFYSFSSFGLTMNKERPMTFKVAY